MYRPGIAAKLRPGSWRVRSGCTSHRHVHSPSESGGVPIFPEDWLGSTCVARHTSGDCMVISDCYPATSCEARIHKLNCGRSRVGEINDRKGSVVLRTGDNHSWNTRLQW